MPRVSSSPHVPWHPAAADAASTPAAAAFGLLAAADPEPSVKLAALSSLTHLVLGGMVKAKGNVAKVAMLLVDDDQGNKHAHECMHG